MAEIVPSNIALWKPFANKGTTLLRRDIICVHTMVGSLPGSYSWASGDGRSYWHFGTSGTGECWQCQGLEYRSAANLEGNPYVIPIENADMGPGFGSWNGQCGHVPAFTQAQVDKLVQLIAHLCKRFNIPATFIPDTRVGRRGIAWHRQGIPGWPEWQGGLLWSKATGKCCPDNARINQLKSVIVPRVQKTLAGIPEEKPLQLDNEDREWLATLVRGEVQRAVQYMAGGRNNAVYDPAKVAWMAEAATLPKVLDAVLSVSVPGGDVTALAKAVADEIHRRLAS
jgi:hypothetical protein